jgi:hypothetical protein
MHDYGRAIDDRLPAAKAAVAASNKTMVIACGEQK